MIDEYYISTVRSDGPNCKEAPKDSSEEADWAAFIGATSSKIPAYTYCGKTPSEGDIKAEIDSDDQKVSLEWKVASDASTVPKLEYWSQVFNVDKNNKMTLVKTVGKAKLEDSTTKSFDLDEELKQIKDAETANPDKSFYWDKLVWSRVHASRSNCKNAAVSSYNIPGSYKLFYKCNSNNFVELPLISLYGNSAGWKLAVNDTTNQITDPSGETLFGQSRNAAQTAQVGDDPLTWTTGTKNID